MSTGMSSPHCDFFLSAVAGRIVFWVGWLHLALYSADLSPYKLLGNAQDPKATRL